MAEENKDVMDTFLDQFEKDCRSLANGHTGDVELMSKTMSSMGKVLVAVLRRDKVTTTECELHRKECMELVKNRSDWSYAKSAGVFSSVAAICVVVLRIIMPLIEK